MNAEEKYWARYGHTISKYKILGYGSRVYNIWRLMLRRCYDKSDNSYYNYGARGIIVCQDWHMFSNFYNWSKNNNYNDNLQIDRIDTFGNYEPSNCRWVTCKENCRNKRDNCIIEYNGQNKCISAWAEEYDIPYYVLHDRLKRGWLVEKALTMPVKTKKASG
jgi:hypothetical protein